MGSQHRYRPHAYKIITASTKGERRPGHAIGYGVLGYITPRRRGPLVSFKFHMYRREKLNLIRYSIRCRLRCRIVVCIPCLYSKTFLLKQQRANAVCFKIETILCPCRVNYRIILNNNNNKYYTNLF